MKLVIAITSAVIVASGAYAQNVQTVPQTAPQTRVPEPEARVPDQPTTGQQQTTDPRATTGQMPIPTPGAGSPYDARGGAIPGVPNPDRVAPGAPGGQREPP
jgi:hypothetical protein